MAIEGHWVHRETWPADLGLEALSDELNRLPATDQQAVFDGMVEFLTAMDAADVARGADSVGEHLGTAAPLLVPGTRLFIRADAATRDVLKAGLTAIMMLATSSEADPTPTFVGISVYSALSILDSMSRLTTADRDVVNVILRLTKSSGGRRPDTRQIADETGASEDSTSCQLASLRDSRVLEWNADGWRVIL